MLLVLLQPLVWIYGAKEVEVLVASEVEEVPAVEGHESDAELDAARSDPGVVLWAGATSELRSGGELAPGSFAMLSS